MGELFSFSLHFFIIQEPIHVRAKSDASYNLITILTYTMRIEAHIGK